MSKLLRAFRSSLEADPGPWLLGASAILAVALWNLPIPAFLFAQAGSGSAPSCQCEVTSEQSCVNWATSGPDRECDNFSAPWEECNDDLGNPDGACAGGKHKVPLSQYVYEKGTLKIPATWCQNAGSHADSGHQYEHDVTWKRRVEVKVTRMGAKKGVRFEPYLQAEPTGFTNGNVCGTSDNGGAIAIKLGLYVKLKIGAAEAIDESKGDKEKGTLGWDIREDSFARDPSTQAWGFSKAYPFGSLFHTELKDLPCATEKVEEIIQFKCRIEQTGRNDNPPRYVFLGKLANSVACITLEATSDPTYCDGF